MVLTPLSEAAGDLRSPVSHAGSAAGGEGSAAGGPRWPIPRVGRLGLGLLLGGLLAGCASTGPGPQPFPVPRGAPETATGPISGDTLAGDALTFQGTPYRPAGADPSGFDCSGLVQYVFARHGIAVPRSVAEQFRTGREVDADRLEPGDLVFFRINARDVSHVGIAVGGGRFVHAPSGRGTVRVSVLDAPYWAKRYAGARRVGGD
jgi:cell wall-associated NlpC family hydrolase